MSTIPPLSGPPLYRYIPGVGKVSAAVNGPTGPRGPPGTAANTGATGPAGVPSIQGRVLRVDQLYGSDVSGALNKYVNPFQTIMGALSNVAAGEVVEILPGTYDEKVVVPANVSVQGIGAQAVIIQQLNCTSNTTLLTMGSNCRVENFTANLSSSSNVDLTGVLFPQGTIPTAKLRNSIWTVTSSALGSNTILGCYSPGTSTLNYFPANMIQRSTLNVISSSAGNTRGILVDGASRFAVRDIVVYARGSGSNIVGGEVTDASGILEIKTSTFGGMTTDASGSAHDINRSAGTIIVGATDLLNNDANGNSFIPTQAPATLQFGIINNLGSDRRYYLVPGTLPVGQLDNENKANAYDVNRSFPVPFTQNSIVIETTLSYTGTLGAGEAITFNIFKNLLTTPSLSVTLASGDGQLKRLTTQSVLFGSTDVLRATLDTSGTPSGGGGFAAIVGYY
jgi:hypothetical protein